MINKHKYKDFMIIGPDGKVIYADVGNTKYFDINMTSITGMNIKQLYTDIDDSYPSLRAARTGQASEYFEIEVTTPRGIKFTKVGCAYPIYQEDEPIAALEFSDALYDKKYIREIEGYAEHPIYRKNNTKYVIDDIITQDPEMIRIKQGIEKLALTDHTVLIYGQTGTGKELIAQALHNGSRRYARKFISVNCGAIPGSIMESMLFGTTKGSFTGATDKAGLFEQADGGTLFLDEINSLDPMLQIKLLKAVDAKTVRRIGAVKEKRINTRIIAATNEDPYVLMESGKMTPDLFYRLSVIYLCLPPLKQRNGDILLLADYFRTFFNKKMKMDIQPFDEDIQAVFENYDWPGNIRELRNVIEGAFAFSEGHRITMNDIPGYIVNKSKAIKGTRSTSDKDDRYFNRMKEQAEKDIIEKTYAACSENLTEAAAKLGISKQLLHYKLLRYGEDKDGNKGKL